MADNVGAKHALVDQFAKDDLIRGQLAQRASNVPHLQPDSVRAAPPTLGIEIREVTKAERDIAVAAASIIARDAFLTGMDTLSEKYEIRLPRGAYQVIEAGREFVAQHGSEALGNVAKLHFNLTDAVCAS